VYNLLTGEGWNGQWLYWSLCWLSYVIIFFTAAIARRQLEDNTGIAFNFAGALTLGLGLAVILTTITGDPRYSIAAGFLGIGLGGFVVGHFAGGGGDE